MKPFHKAEPVQSAPTHYSPSVPMSVYRELAAELRANKAVIDSLNSRNQQLITQNQRLKQEIHNVVQATLNLGQFAGVARPAEHTQQESSAEFPSAIAPDTLAKLVRAQGEARKSIPSAPVTAPLAEQSATADYVGQLEMPAVPETPAHHTGNRQDRQTALRRKPRPIQKASANPKSPDRAPAPRKSVAKPAAKAVVKKVQSKTQNRSQGNSQAKVKSPASVAPRSSQREAIVQTKPLPKLFTEQAGEYRNAPLSSGEEKEIGGIWLALSIILIIVTAFGAGFLIMKPLLNDR